MHRVCSAWLTAMIFGTCAACSKPASSPPANEGSEVEEGTSGDEGEGDDASFASLPASEHGSRNMAEEASRVLATMTFTSYSHKTRVDGNGYYVDCSGFVDYLLARVDPVALKELREATVRRPLAKHYVEFLRQPPTNGHWQRISRTADLAPGDIVAWLKPADVSSRNTGHVMVVSAAPQPRGASEWVVPIIDSTATPHGRSDARKAANATGIGRGTIVLETDVRGTPVAYMWTDGKAHRHATEIAMGRVR